MSEYSAVLQSVKGWDLSLKYDLVQDLLQDIYAEANVKHTARDNPWTSIDDMGLKAPVSWLTREECYER